MPETLFSPPFTDDLERLHSEAEISAYLKDWHARLNTPAGVAEAGADLLAQNTSLVDAVLRRLFAGAVEQAGPQESLAALAIVATGGYGRRELAPFSDVDVTFVSAHEDDPTLNAIIKDMFQRVMDVFLYGANLKVGYAYRLLGDLGQLDHQTQTTLLDSRFLCGDQELFREFRRQFRAQLLTADFLFQKWAERQSVLLKHGGDQPYVIEPNIKEGAGGLRDIQNAEWMGEVRFHVGLSRLWPTLVEQGFVTATEAEALLQSRQFLWRVRCALHIANGEARELLTPEKQETIAAMLGYPDAHNVPPVETFMRDYYTRVAEARRVSRKAIQRILDSPLPLGMGLASVERALVVTDREAAERDAVLPLHMAELAQAYSLALSADMDTDVAAFLERFPAPTDPALAGRVLTRLLTAERGVAETLERLEEWGALGWLIPEFGATMTLIPYDAAHAYTVGAHSLRVVRVLEGLKTVSDPRLATLRRLGDEIASPEVLSLAGLIHDVGKQWAHGPHSETGAVAAAQICERLGWDAERTSKVVWLVRRHLLMAETSRLRDLALDETIRDFLKHVPDMDALNMLYLLTYADTQAVGEGIWTDVKGKFLGELYHRTEAVLAAPADAERAPGAPPPAASLPNVARQRERIRRGLTKHDLPPDIIHEHTRNLPAQYLLNTPVEEMYVHIAMINRLRETFQPIVDFRSEYGADYTELTLCAFDDPKPGLLAKITGVLYACDVNVHVAQVFTREASVRIALDTLWVDYRGKPLSSGKKAELQDALRRVLLGEQGVGQLLQQRKKPLKEQTIYTATIDDASSERFSLLDVSAPDERGVLYRLTRAISALDWTIHAARLSVSGSRARDAFYITDVDGRKIPAADAQRLHSALPHAPLDKKRIAFPGKG
ncbi:MAG: HD domain-containing protein [Armatimonadota bacterium]|nr:HD domain-containing protein [Armatimonadota bacterium]